MQNKLTQAKELLSQGNFPKAKLIYEEILTEFPNNAEALHYYGMLLAQTDEMENALNYVRKAIAVDPEQAIYYNTLGNIYKRLKLFDKALSNYQTALKLAPDSAQVYNNIAIILIQLGQIDEATKHYQSALQINPNYTDAHFNLALLYLQQNKIDNVIIELKKVITLNPQHLTALKLLADLLLQQNDIAQAKKLYQLFLSFQENDCDVLTNLGACFVKEKEYEQAIANFQQALLIDEHHVGARNNLAACFLHQDRYENAARHYEILLQQTPDDIETHYNLGVAQMAIGKLPEAKACFAKVITIDPKRTDAYCNLGAVYAKLGQTDAALKQYHEALKLDPENKIVHYMISALEQQQDFTAAPGDYVKNLFDNYAGYYEKHVSEVLHYQVPEIIRKKLLQLKQKQQIQWKILDLGCGTGMMGNRLQDMLSYLVGVDISEKMLQIAKLRNTYDELYCLDLTKQLKQINNHFEVIVAADVFVYIGDIAAIFKQCYELLNDKGYFIFSVEALKETDADYHLQPTARYAHHKKYINQLVQQNNFKLIAFDDITPRYQDDKPIAGYLIVLQKNHNFSASAPL